MLVLAAASAIALFAGCGDDDEDEAGTASAEVELQARTEVAVDEDKGTKDPVGIEVLEELPQLQRASSDDSVPAIRGSAGLTIPEWLDTVNGDVAAYWQQSFNGSEYRYEAPFQEIFDRPVRTRCGGKVPVDAGPFYCELDQTIFLPVPFFAAQAKRFGDAGPAVIVAHENAHHVQNLLGIFDKRRLKTIQTELQADCLAGVWASSVLERGLIEPGDIGEILGEVEISGDPPGTPVKQPGAHGSSELRAQAFVRGYEGGRPGDCPIPDVS